MRHFGQSLRKKLHFARTQLFTVFEPHSACPGASIFILKMASGMHCARTRNVVFERFFPTSGAKVTPKVAPRRTQGRPKGPQGRQKTPPGHLKTIKKSTCDPTWSSKAAQEPPGVPPSTEIDPKSLEKLNFPPPPEREHSRGSDALPQDEQTLPLPCACHLTLQNPFSAAAERSYLHIMFCHDAAT